MNHKFTKQALRMCKSIDVFAQPVQLYIKQETGHKTILGAFLSTLIFSFLGYIFITNVLTLQNRNNPMSYSTDVYRADPENYQLDSNNFTLTFAFQSSNFKTYIDESVYVVEATLNKRILKTVNGSQTVEWQQQSMPLAPCSKSLLKQESLKNYFSHIDLQTNYCIDWNNINQIGLQGTFDSKEFQYILIQFKMCNQQSQKSKTCKTKEQIKSILEQNYFSLQLSSHVIDVKSEKQPFLPTGQDLFTTISSKIFKEISIYLQPISIFSDFGIISEDIEEEKTLRYIRNTEMIDLNESDLIMNVVIRLDQIEVQHYRSYQKLYVILSQIGGLWQIIFTIALFIQRPINKLSYYLRIINALFQFEQPQPIQTKDDQIIQQSFNMITSNKQVSSLREVPIKDIQLRASQRLKSIKLKKAQLEELEQIQEDAKLKYELKQKLSQTISQSIKEYFQSISKKLKFTLWDYFQYFSLYFNSNNHKALQAQYSIKKTCRYLDIIHILKKLQEIDKLKMILLSDAQIKVFDYLQKPTIPLNPKSSNSENQNNFQNYPLLTPIKSDYKRAIDAQKAFKELVENLHDPISRKLINCIDNTISDFLQLKRLTNELNAEESQINEEFDHKNNVLVLNTQRNILIKQQNKSGNESPQISFKSQNIIYSDDEINN